MGAGDSEDIFTVLIVWTTTKNNDFNAFPLHYLLVLKQYI